MLSKVESEAGDSAASVAEFLAAKFSRRFPHVRVGRPGWFLETVRRIAGPIKHQRLNGSARRSYLKRRWTPRTRNTTYLGLCECHIVWCIPNFVVYRTFKRNIIPFWWLFARQACYAIWYMGLICDVCI